ncbi:MAG: S9 family peptidase [Kordiimonadaceae bacterium]|nr:S9 family peptidase [Kordiimonadaceae bacterium]
MKKISTLLLIMILMPIAVMAQDMAKLTPERIFSGEDFKADRLPSSKWIDGGEAYTTIDDNEDIEDGFDIVKNNTLTGEREILISADKLIPPGAEKPLKIEDYKWSDDAKHVLISTNTKQFRRLKSFGDYWILNLENNNLRQIGTAAPEQSLMYAKFSPDSQKIAYMYENNIYVETIASADVTQLTHDGTELIVNGTGDWVYEEELRLRDAFMWSPDSKRIAYWQFDTSGVGTFYLMDNTSDLYSKPIAIQYPKAGTTISAVRVGSVMATGGETTWFKAPGDPRQHYIAKMEWAESSEEVIIQQLNRLQNVNHVMLGNAISGDVTTILKDSNEAWVDMRASGLRWLKDGAYFTFLSEKDGWRHLYRFSRDGEQETLLTTGDYEVISIVNIDDAGGWVYFMASPDSAAQRYLYRVNLEGEPIAEKLTPEDQTGTHTYNLAPDSKYAFHTYARFGTPPVIDLVSLPTHKSEKVMATNEKMHKAVNELERGKVEFFNTDVAQGYSVNSWMMYPPDFDPDKKYPLIIYVYGYPGGNTVTDNWGGNRYLWHRMLTEQGYVVASFNNPGDGSNRGAAWRKDGYKKIGQLTSLVQSQAASELLDKHSFLDKDRVGIWGWSGGGASTLDAMTRYPDIYKTGISVAPISDARLYDSIYQERYLGLPEEGEDAYYLGSAVNYAHQLKGNLLIIHGTGDDNVHYQNLEYMTNKLIELNKPFEMMSYPMRAHGIRKGDNTQLHLFTHITKYLNEHLPAGGR